MIGVGVGGSTNTAQYNLLIDDITVVRTGLSLPNKTDQNFISAVNTEMEFVNRVVQGVPGLIAEGGKAIRLDYTATPTLNSTGHQYPALYSGNRKGMHNFTMEMWFRTTAPFNTTLRRRHVLHSHQNFDSNAYYGLFIDEQTKSVQFVVKYVQTLPISLPLANEMEPHHVVLIFTAEFNQSEGYYYDAKLILDGNSTRYNTSSPYCTSASVCFRIPVRFNWVLCSK